MGTAEQILVVILSSFLAIFLLLGIIVLVFVIKIVRSIKRITEHAENVVHKAEVFSEFVQSANTPLKIARMFADLSDHFMHRKSRKRRRNDDE